MCCPVYLPLYAALHVKLDILIRNHDCLLLLRVIKTKNQRVIIMSKPLLGMKVAVLAANGFCEQDMTESQRALLDAGANVRIVSSEQGLLNGWNGTAWGHHFAVDSVLSTALGADYSVLLIPGGQRSLDKLKLTAHTKRFISSFIASSKPVVVFDDALHIMIMSDNIKGRTVAGPDDMMDVALQAGAFWADDSIHVDDNLMSGVSNTETRSSFISGMLNFLTSCETLMKAA